MFTAIKIFEGPRSSKNYVQVCPNCQCERYITYPQAWNINTGRNRKECKSCAIELGHYKINIDGLKAGRKFWPRKKNNIENKGTFYQNIFRSEQSKNKMRISQSITKKGKFAELANNWQGGKTLENRRLRGHPVYQKFVKDILKLYNYTCTSCGSGQNLHVHHIKPWSKYPKLRMKKSNCTVLCKKCHFEVHHGS